MKVDVLKRTFPSISSGRHAEVDQPHSQHTKTFDLDSMMPTSGSQTIPKEVKQQVDVTRRVLVILIDIVNVEYPDMPEARAETHAPYVAYLRSSWTTIAT